MSLKPSYQRLALICVAVLIAAYLSQNLHSVWFTLTIKDRVFRSSVLLDILECIPFIWPFAIGGFLLARNSRPLASGLVWLSALSILGGLLYSHRVTLLLTPPDSVWNYPRFYVRYAFPFALSAFGFLVGCLFQRNEVA